MSDEDSERSDEEEEENSDDGSSGSSGSNGSDSESDNEVDKELKAQADILLINDIFTHIDMTSKRIVAKFETERQLRGKPAVDQGRQRNESLDTSDVSWSQYENFDEEQRANLLSKAINVLAQDSGSKHT